MSSYTKWDRDAYIDRVGGEAEAERRRKALMARQSGYLPPRTPREPAAGTSDPPDAA